MAIGLYAAGLDRTDSMNDGCRTSVPAMSSDADFRRLHSASNTCPTRALFTIWGRARRIGSHGLQFHRTMLPLPHFVLSIHKYHQIIANLISLIANPFFIFLRFLIFALSPFPHFVRLTGSACISPHTHRPNWYLFRVRLLFFTHNLKSCLNLEFTYCT